MRFVGVKAVVSVSALAFVAMFAAQAARADAVITIQQDGSNVVATGSGSIDLSGLLFDAGPVASPGAVRGNEAGAFVGGGDDDVYNGFSGPRSFGTGAFTMASTSSGDSFGVSGGGDELFVPDGYVSGTALSGTATFDSTTIADLGLTDGTYTYTWGNGASADTLTVQIGPASTPPAATPEPSSLALLGSGVLGVAGVVRRRMRR